MTKELAKTNINRSSRFMVNKLEQTSSGAICQLRRGGFTLIELLVVVLIIGILVSVALPQYQKAVLKSRYATLKNLTNSIAQAAEVYYLENNSYATSFEELVLSMPEGKLDTSTDTRYEYSWGMCYIEDNRIYCGSEQANMGYMIYFQPNARYCVARGTSDSNNVRSKICQAETGKTSPYNSKEGEFINYQY